MLSLLLLINKESEETMHEVSKESLNIMQSLQQRVNDLEKELKEYQLIQETGKESEENMTLSVMLALLTITTEYSYSIVKLNEIQAIEVVDKGKDNGGILTITLKGDKEEQIVHSENDIDKWNDVKKWLETNTLNLSSEMSKKDLHRHKDVHPGF